MLNYIRALVPNDIKIQILDDSYKVFAGVFFSTINTKNTKNSDFMGI